MHRDYVMRLIEQIAQAIATIIALRKAGKHKEAIEQIKTTSRRYIREDLSLLLLQEPEKVVDHFKDATNTLDAERAILFADLLYELALIQEAEGAPEAALHIKQLCLSLYTASISADKKYAAPYSEKVTLLKQALNC